MIHFVTGPDETVFIMHHAVLDEIMDVQSFKWINPMRGHLHIPPRDVKVPGIWSVPVRQARMIILPDTNTQVFALFVNWVYSGRYQPGFLSRKVTMSVQDAGPDGPLHPETVTIMSTFLHACILGENICLPFYKEVAADVRRMYLD